LEEFIHFVQVPYIIVFNKQDLASDEENRVLKSKLPEESRDKQIEYTNAKDGENLDSLVKTIMATIKQYGLLELDLKKFHKLDF
jgi:50S ribosomal subunit-associated GTPase HflX